MKQDFLYEAINQPLEDLPLSSKLQKSFVFLKLVLNLGLKPPNYFL